MVVPVGTGNQELTIVIKTAQGITQKRTLHHRVDSTTTHGALPPW